MFRPITARSRRTAACPVLFLLMVTGPIRPAYGQGTGELELQRLTDRVTLDGSVDDPAWQHITPLPLTMYGPVYRGDPTQRTEILVAYDDEYLYAAGRFHDSQPNAIRTNSLNRDRWSGDDAFALFLDPFNDNDTGVWFMTNPAGIRLDQSLGDDGDTSNESWNAFWDVATRELADGWSAEMRIPFSSLRFQERGGRVVMGMTVSRLVSRTNERVTFPAIDPRYDFRQPSVMQDVVLRGVASHRPLYVTPYALGGFDQTASLSPDTSRYTSPPHGVREIGGDIKYALSDNTNLDLTLNTDFATVEADDERVNLTRFPLFFPEKRQFFQERAGIFQFDFGAGGRLFHSRRIGLAPDRTPIRMIGGVRLTARAGAWDVGVLDVQTASRETTSSDNLAVVRMRRRVFNEYSNAGGMVTSRITADGGYNVALGMDASVRIVGNEYLTFKTAATFDDRQTDADFADRGQMFVEWARRSTRGLRYFGQIHRVGSAYRPELGFLSRQDFTRLSLYTVFSFWPGDEPALRAHGPGFIGNLYFRNGDGSLETVLLGWWWEYEFREGASGWIEVYYHFEDVRESFSLGDGVSVLPGRYTFPTLWLVYSTAPGRLLRGGIDARIEGFYDGWHAQLILDPTWNISRHLEVSGEYEFNRVRFPTRRTGLDTHVARAKIHTAADARLSATAFVQLNTLSDRVGINVRIRYNFREGNDLWVVYDEAINTDRDGRVIDSIPLPVSATRAVRVKFTYTLVL